VIICVKTEDRAVAIGQCIDPTRWQETFEILMGRIGGRFARVEPWGRAREFVLGLYPAGLNTTPAPSL
jgi:broad specificity phosphatase PhoE